MEIASRSDYINPNHIGFFFGAGASIEFGIPSMKQLTESFAQTLQQNNSVSNESKIFEDIYDSLAEEYGRDKVDLEAVMSVIVGLKEKNQVRDNIGDLGLFILHKKGATGLTELDYSRATLDRLEAEYKAHVRANVVIRRPQMTDLCREVYIDFFRQICSVSTCNSENAPESDLGKYIHANWTFFTTNYDNTIEDFWFNERKYTDLDLGFKYRDGRKIMDANSFLYSNTEGFNRMNVMQLVKLHGSVNWIKNIDNQIEEHPYHSNFEHIKSIRGSKDILDDLMIYPLSQKQLYFTPFLQLFGILNVDLSRRQYWIVIGYSFRDIIIRTMFEKALFANSKRKVLLIHPNASEEIRPLFHENLQSQIVSLDSHFARQNYNEVNSEISRTLLTLPG